MHKFSNPLARLKAPSDPFCSSPNYHESNVVSHPVGLHPPQHFTCMLNCSRTKNINHPQCLQRGSFPWGPMPTCKISAKSSIKEESALKLKTHRMYDLTLSIKFWLIIYTARLVVCAVNMHFVLTVILSEYRLTIYVSYFF